MTLSRRSLLRRTAGVALAIAAPGLVAKAAPAAAPAAIKTVPIRLRALRATNPFIGVGKLDVRRLDGMLISTYFVPPEGAIHVETDVPLTDGLIATLEPLDPRSSPSRVTLDIGGALGQYDAGDILRGSGPIQAFLAA